MVRKLYKHEFIAWLRVMPIIWAAALVVAGIHRLIQLFENDSVYYVILSVLATIVFVLALLACSAFTVIFGVVRFYKNFFTGEGYLTFTLPVSHRAHLWVKVSTAVCFSLIASLVCLLSGWIVTAGEVFTEVVKAARYLLNQAPREVMSQLPWYGVEYLALLLVGGFYGYLTYAFCICLGQTVRKNRILAAVGIYFGLYMILQALSTVGNLAFMLLTEAGVLDPLHIFIENQVWTFIHIALCSLIALFLVGALVFWLICHRILRKRNNLE